MRFTPTAKEARLSEVFSSLQGEGTHVGQRHLFVRFEECHIHCKYCDELDKVGVETPLNKLTSQINALEKEEGPHSYVSLTGGEPLIYLNYLKPLMGWLKAHQFKTYLETDGILWKSLEQVIAITDCVAMDLKPSSVTGERNFIQEHRHFLSIARQCEVFTKMVVSKEIDIPEFEEHVELVKKIDHHIPLILMPVSSGVEGHKDENLMKLLHQLQCIASERLTDVRIVPRLHKILNIR